MNGFCFSAPIRHVVCEVFTTSSLEAGTRQKGKLRAGRRLVGGSYLLKFNTNFKIPLMIGN